MKNCLSYCITLFLTLVFLSSEEGSSQLPKHCFVKYSVLIDEVLVNVSDLRHAKIFRQRNKWTASSQSSHHTHIHLSYILNISANFMLTGTP